MYDWLPELVLLEDHGGNWEKYVAVIYGLFRRDFITSRPSFPNKHFHIKRNPFYDGKESSFWHLIQEGEIEEDRLPDLRRCERIRWPRKIIDFFNNSSNILWWKEKQRNNDFFVIAIKDFSYIVVLADRGDYVLLWTAYPIERNHRRKKKKKAYDKYIKAEAANNDDPVTPSTRGGRAGYNI